MPTNINYLSLIISFTTGECAAVIFSIFLRNETLEETSFPLSANN